jgi:hypothetical protein
MISICNGISTAAISATRRLRTGWLQVMQQAEQASEQMIGAAC